MIIDEIIVNLLKGAEAIYKAEGNSVYDTLSSDGKSILDKEGFSEKALAECASLMELYAKILFCEHCKAEDIKEFIEAKRKHEEIPIVWEKSKNDLS